MRTSGSMKAVLFRVTLIVITMDNQSGFDYVMLCSHSPQCVILHQTAWTPLRIKPTSAWIHGFILHNGNGLCEMTWWRGFWREVRWPKRFLYLCVYSRQSSIRARNKLNIFKTDKNKKQILFHVKSTVLIMLWTPWMLWYSNIENKNVCDDI